VAVTAGCLLATAARAQDVGFTSAWPALTAGHRDQVMEFGEDFKMFMCVAKVVKEDGAGRETNSEFFAKIRGLLDREKVRWQNTDVMDVGIGILSMQSTCEVSSKADLWQL
jgi:hypothetical protein